MSSTSEPIIELEGLSVNYQHGNSQLQVLEDLSLVVSRGQSLVVLGPSGCGKTTLLHTIAGLQEPASGIIQRHYGPEQQALILQKIGLLPWKTVWENALLGLQLRGDKSDERARILLKELELSGLEESYPSQLSGGQQKRLALVRALAVDPLVLLMDEPLVSLDEFIREKLQKVILELWTANDLTMVLVTHDLEEAAFLGESISLMESTPSEIKETVENPQMGTPDFRRSDDYYQLVKKLRGKFS